MHSVSWFINIVEWLIASFLQNTDDGAFFWMKWIAFVKVKADKQAKAKNNHQNNYGDKNLYQCEAFAHKIILIILIALIIINNF